MPATIHVACELLSGSCPFNAVLRHEQRHVRTVADLLREYAGCMLVPYRNPAYRREIRNGGATEDQAEADINRMGVAVVRSLVAGYKAATEALNKKIDSVDETRAAVPGSRLVSRRL